MYVVPARPDGTPDRQRLSSLTSSILDGLPDPAWMIDAAGVLVDFNAAFLSFVRAIERREARRGIPFHELMAGTQQEELWRDLTRRVRDGRSVAADARFNAAGIERVYTIHGTPAQDAAFFVAREVLVPHALRDDSLELALMRPFSSEPTLEGALRSAIEFLAVSDEWVAAVVWLIEDDALVSRAIWLHDSLHHADSFREKVESLHFKKGHGLPGRAWVSDDLIWVSDLMDESGLARGDVAARSGLHTVVAVPLRESNQIIGVIELFDRAVRPISTPPRQSLERVSLVIGRLVERRRADDERKRLIALVERKGKEWALTFDSIPQPIFLTSRDGVVVRMNRAGRDLAGAPTYQDILGRPLGSLGEGEPWITLRDLVTACAESGEACTAHVETGSAVLDIDAALHAEERIIVTIRDMTEVLRLQESVRRGEQLAALGELVAGVAHQVKNPLFGIGMTVDLLQEQVGSKENEELFAALRTWLHRLDRLMESLLAYGKTWTLDLKPHGVRSVLEQALELCRPTALANGVRIDLHAEGDAEVLMDANRLTHAFENVITNAAQHSTREHPVDVTLTVEDDFVEVMVSDRGPGFREEDLPRIFEPFFTRRRGGTGLGLSIVQRVVDECGGITAAENAKSGGAVVRIRLPRYDERKAARDSAPHSDRR